MPVEYKAKIYTLNKMPYDIKAVMMGAFAITLGVQWFSWGDNNRTDHINDYHVVIAGAGEHFLALFQVFP